MNGSPGSIPGIGTGDTQMVKMEPQDLDLYSMSGGSGVTGSFGSPNGIKPISPEQEELIQRLVFYQNEFETPNEEDVKKITVGI